MTAGSMPQSDRERVRLRPLCRRRPRIWSSCSRRPKRSGRSKTTRGPPQIWCGRWRRSEPPRRRLAGRGCCARLAVARPSEAPSTVARRATDAPRRWTSPGPIDRRRGRSPESRRALARIQLAVVALVVLAVLVVQYLDAASLMRMRGLEPPRPYGHTDLNRARLPIPPHPRGLPILASARLISR